MASDTTSRGTRSRAVPPPAGPGGGLTRRGRLVVTLMVVAALIAGAYVVVTRSPLGTLLGFGDAPPCTLTVVVAGAPAGDGGAAVETLEWSAVQAMTATTVAGVGTRIGASENGIAAAVRRAMQAERDVPLPADAARELYRDLPDVARPGPEAVAVARALTGVQGDALACALPLVGGAELAVEAPNGRGLTPRADAVRVETRQVFGKQSLGGFSPDGVDSGHIEGSAHYDGRAVDVFFRPITEAGTREGWQQSMWLVANAGRLSIATVIFDRRIWTAARSVQGWRDYEHPNGPTDSPVLLHEDHVHVDVERGV